jgi:hypothetical protein
LRRLFSNFAPGWPGAGLLFLRLVAGATILVRAFSGAAPVQPSVLNAAVLIDGILLFAGLWTPISGSLLGALELWKAYSNLQDPWEHILLAGIGAALALVGPGAWSVDARLFGWKRIDVRERQG